MKLAAFDFDGTILFDDGITGETLDAIRAWQAAGNVAVAATGKSLSAAQFSLNNYDLTFDYSVLYTGAAVADREQQILYSRSLDPLVVEAIVETLVEVEGIAVYGTRLGEPDGRFKDDTGLDETTILRSFEELSIDDIPGSEFVGIPVWVPGDWRKQEEIETWLGTSFDVSVASNQEFVDVVPVGATKGAGLQWLGRHLGVRRSEVEVYTFGDSFNDLSMHSIADRSFCFPWSPDGVKEQTDEVVDSVADALMGVLRSGSQRQERS